MSDQKTAVKADIASIIKNNIRSYTMFIILFLIMIVFGFLTKWINFGSRNITYIFIQYSYVLILATGMVQVMIVQGIDLSVGSICAFIGAISVMLYNVGVGMPVALLTALVLGLAIGAFHGVWVAYAGMPAFVVTLAGMLLFRGLTYIITNVSPVTPHDDGYKQIASGMVNIPGLEIHNVAIFGQQVETVYLTAILAGIIVIVLFIISEIISRQNKIKNNFDVTPPLAFVGKIVLISVLILFFCERFATYRGLPSVVVVLGITVMAFHFVLKNTVLGRYIYAVGGNPRSAKLSGINSEQVVFIVFCIAGFLTGLAAVVSTGYMNSALPQAGNLFEMDAIAACYIGGVSASGGIGTVVGVIVGGLVMSAINNGMSLMNLGQHYQYVVKAMIVLLAVFYDVYSRRKAGLG
ncbi:MAG: sugar ABC transporter permease [Treponema sp.]|jgi:putative multiple sugar transport system permease protein|nr:sugar ABC transporter permease [Treponema sp.]